MDPKWFDEAHGTHDAGDDKGRRAQQFSYRQTTRIRAQGRERRKDVGAAITKREEGDTRDVLVQVQKLRDRCQIGAEEIRGTDAKGGKKETEPKQEAKKDERPSAGSGAKIGLQVRNGKECVGCGAPVVHDLALVFDRNGYWLALRERLRIEVYDQWIRPHTLCAPSTLALYSLLTRRPGKPRLKTWGSGDRSA
jgi:hypothetical protein